MTYTDRELEQMDRAAARRLHDAEFARRHPEYANAHDWLRSIVEAPQAALIRAARKAEPRRYTGEEITGFGSEL